MQTLFRTLHNTSPHIVKATCTPLHGIIPATARIALPACRLPQIDIQSVSRHCFPINPYWELAHARRAYTPPSNRNLFMKIYCIRHYRGFFSYGSDPAERNHLIQFPFCIHHTRVSSKGNIEGFCLYT